jgi:hypothetical protein
VKELWVSEHPEAHLWLVVEPIDMDAQRELYHLLDPLYERFPMAEFLVHIRNPNDFRGDVHQAIPPFAEQISLRVE